MNILSVDFDKNMGKVKPMHAVNNGPKTPGASQVKDNFEAFKAAGIPYARNHDANHCAAYGGEHIVDIYAIFPNFDADPYDPASYDFDLTDDYTADIVSAGTQVFYRLGAKIEHKRKKYCTIMPKDFHKWAVICEHIIRHYNEGWANGFNYGFEYWEIWNEPDLDTDDSPNKRTWSGTAKEFYEFYKVAANHLKSCFPHLKIGGPALASKTGEWLDGFLEAITADGKKTPMDFFSWHIYAPLPSRFIERAKLVREKLDKAGYTETESILNEWNYVCGWTDRFIESIEAIISIKGAAFTAACMALCQYSSVDMLMYYDARVSTAFNGMFDFYTLRPLKGYYPFPMFNRLYRLGTAVECKSENPDICAVAAKNNDGESAIMISYFCNEEDGADIEITLDLSEKGKPYEIYILDEKHNCELCGNVTSGEKITLKPNSVLLLNSK